jgi:hypothetical protein
LTLRILQASFDGEGSIAINRSRGKGAHVRGSWTAHFNVGGTDEQTIQWIAETFNGEFKTYSSLNHWKDTHKCRWTYESGSVLIPYLIPLLKTKRLQAIYYYEFVTRCSSIIYGRSLPEHVRKRAAELASLCASVNDHQRRWKGTGV